MPDDLGTRAAYVATVVGRPKLFLGIEGVLSIASTDEKHGLLVLRGPNHELLGVRFNEDRIRALRAVIQEFDLDVAFISYLNSIPGMADQYMNAFDMPGRTVKIANPRAAGFSHRFEAHAIAADQRERLAPFAWAAPDQKFVSKEVRNTFHVSSLLLATSMFEGISELQIKRLREFYSSLPARMSGPVR